MKNNIIKMLNEAAHVAAQKNDDRHFRVGSVAIRGDGTMVSAYNGAPKYPDRLHHSEGRLCRKLDRGATVYVARIRRDGELAMARPCNDCERALRRSYVKRVYYSISKTEYGCLLLDTK